MKLEPRLPQLPSLSELLEHPRVKGLVERVNRSTLAQRAGGFLEEVRSTLVERAGRVEAPTLTHLAERLARRLLGEPISSGPVINATGLLLGDATLTPPLPEASLHAMVQLAGEYHRCDIETVRAAERGLCELLGGEAAWLTSNFESALTLAMAAGADGAEAAVCGAADIESPVNWRWLAARAGAVIADSSRAATAAAIVRAPDADQFELSALAASKSREACLIDAAPIAGAFDPADHGRQSVTTVAQRLEAGADLIVISGGGLLGGPACGVIIGSRRWIDAVARRPLASVVAVDPMAVAAMHAVLRLYRDDKNLPVIYQLPVWQLLSAPLANLEQRAKRLAVLLADSPLITSAEARAVESPWRAWGGQTWNAPTWVVELKVATGGDARSLAARLREGSRPIACREAASDGVQLDLRSVFPRWDEHLATALRELS